PFLFARPSLKVFQNSAFGFSLKKVRISFNRAPQKKFQRTFTLVLPNLIHNIIIIISIQDIWK
ncbi:hypothetical protein CO115_01360, partial [Candidatus Falkowbacteria bacterium CG_4_9_14_3_um_filter_36_9]